MGAPSETQVREYLRAHPVAGLGEVQQIIRLPSPDDEQRYLVSAGNARVVLKRYAPAAVDRARREATGLKMGSRVGLAPELLLFDGAGGPLGGPVVAFAPPAGAPLGGARMSDADVQNWVFLLLALHHLPPTQVDVPSGMSPDLATWWQRMQPQYQACRVAYTSKITGPLLKALTQLYAVVGARVEARKALWRDVTRRPCHGNAVAEHVVSDGGRLALVEWGDFGLGDPALEVGRAAGLSLLTGELSTTQYTNFIGSYLRGASDLADKSIAERILLFTSVQPLGFAFAVLQVATARDTSPAERTRLLDQAAAALAQTAEALKVSIGDPQALLAPLR
jgi:hypothetical protein